jgi:hypothetical protein
MKLELLDVLNFSFHFSMPKQLEKALPCSFVVVFDVFANFEVLDEVSIDPEDPFRISKSVLRDLIFYILIISKS